MRLILITIAVMFSTLAIAEKPHSAMVYMIVPRANFTPAMRRLIAQRDLHNARKTTSGPVLVLVSIARWKLRDDPMPNPLPNDYPLRSGQLVHNRKVRRLQNAHKITPVLLQPYLQYSYAEIKIEMEKAEWQAIPIGE